MHRSPSRIAASVAEERIVPMPTKAIIFQNEGLIDLCAITTMGVSVKNDGAIGYFGTGLKFAIATILRNKGRVTIWRGMEAFTFTAESITVRKQEFDRVCMNGESLGFTTMLGRDWKPWMAFRELASNCRDEGGDYCIASDVTFPKPGRTTIVLEGAAMLAVWGDRRSIMLECEPLLTTDSVEVREGITQYVYYRGVRIAEAPRPLAFTYNILEPLELTEDRTAKSWWDVEFRIERGIGAVSDRPIMRRMLTCGETFQEHHMDVPRWGNPGETFREVAREISLGGERVLNANPKAVSYARASAISDMRAGDGVALDPIQSRMLEKATAILKAGGYDVEAFPIIVCETLGPSIHGMAQDGKIFLSLMPFEKGTREVAATLLEEFAHLKSGQSDCTRGFQNWLFDQMLVRAERQFGEPF